MDDGVYRLNNVLLDLQSELVNINNTINDADFLIISSTETDKRKRDFLRGGVEAKRNTQRIIRRILEKIRKIPVVELKLKIDTVGYIEWCGIPVCREEAGVWRLYNGEPIGDNIEEAYNKILNIIINNNMKTILPKIKVEGVED